MDLNEIQLEVEEWATEKFGERLTAENQLQGMNEEMGELAGWSLEQIVPVLHMMRQLGRVNHHDLKRSQHIKGSPEWHDEKIQDALGDIVIYMMNYCSLKGWKLDDIIYETWQRVKPREYIEDPEYGIARYYGEITDYMRGLKNESDSAD